MNKAPTDFFSKATAQGYDARNSKLAHISNCLHFLMSLILRDLPERSQILCVGAGTGAEILSLAEAFPEWEFVALDPSQAMLEVCRDRLKGAGVEDRCKFVHGFVQDLPQLPHFDAVLSILVAHFVKREERIDFYRNMIDRVRKGGYFINAEISFDLDSAESPSMIKNWEVVQGLMGATPESLAKLSSLLQDVLTVVPPAQTENFIRLSGINCPVRFFQALMICGWYGKKDASPD